MDASEDIKEICAMKKICFILTAAIAIASAVSFAGCGSANTGSTASGSEATSAAESVETTASLSGSDGLKADDVVFELNGAKVELNGDADAAVEALGKAKDVSSQLSCHGEGEDKTYTYDGFVLNTYPLEGKDHVLEIVINSKDIPTSKGVKIGDPVSAVTDAYGTGYKEIGLYYAYDADGGKSLQFFIQDGAVQEISYYYDV